MRVYPIQFNNESFTLYHNSEEWVLHDGEKVVTWSAEAGALFDLYGKEGATKLYGEIVNVTEFGKGDHTEDENVPQEVLTLAEKFSD